MLPAKQIDDLLFAIQGGRGDMTIHFRVLRLRIEAARKAVAALLSDKKDRLITKEEYKQWALSKIKSNNVKKTHED